MSMKHYTALDLLEELEDRITELMGRVDETEDYDDIIQERDDLKKQVDEWESWHYDYHGDTIAECPKCTKG